ncbi:transposase family protein [Pasteuria penetrans]|uniref:transposase family protein n=1 Tax=Pasteuria penetrans TaxID=86005 RepID=UPI00248282A1|nr:transposase family protein [Pasteuria penetrans]
MTAPNQLWEMDIQHERLPNGTPVFVLSILDVFDRVIVFSDSYLSCKSGDVVKAVQTALDQYAEDGKDKPVLRTDNGSQFISHEFHGFIEAEGIDHERIPVQSPIAGTVQFLVGNALSMNLVSPFRKAIE